MPDLVNDPKYDGIDIIRPEEESQYSPEELRRRRDLWREWADKQRDAAAHLTQNAAEQGIDADTALSRAGFADEKEKGKYIWSLFSNNGLFATQGDVDPNLEYDWNRGVKTWKKGTDNEGQSIPITRDEYASRRQAQQYQDLGLKGWGAHANAEAFGRAVGYGHFTLDPRTGRYYNVGTGNPNDPSTWMWNDTPTTRAYNQVHGVGGGAPQRGGGGGGGYSAPQPPGGGWLPYQGENYGGYGGFGGGDQMAQYGGGGYGGSPGFGGMQGGGYSGYGGGVPDMYAGTRAAMGIPQPGGGQVSTGQARAQQQQQEDLDANSPYKQLLPPGSPGAPPAKGISTGLLSQQKAQNAQLGGS